MTNNPTYLSVFLLHSLFSILSVFCIYKQLIPQKYSYVVFLFISFIALVMMLVSNASFTDFGIVVPSLESLVFYSIVTLLVSLGILFFNKYVAKNTSLNMFTNKNFLRFFFYILISAPFQEYLFRTYLFYSLSNLGSLHVVTYVVLSSLLFSYAHIFSRSFTVLAGTWILGAIYAVLYYFYPNLILLSFSHAIVGSVALYFSLVKGSILFTK